MNQSKKELRIEHIFNELNAAMRADSDLGQTYGHDSLKNRMFREIVQRSIADVSGHLNLADQSRSDQNKRESTARVTVARVFDLVQKALTTFNKDSSEILRFFLSNTSGYSKGIVQTPHPTEMLEKQAIIEEEHFLSALEHQGKILFEREGSKLQDLGEDKNIIITTLRNLYEALEPVTEKLQIKDEMDRSIVFSERMFDAVPMIADRILTSAKHFSRKLSSEDRKHFAHLVEPLTWSPGDQDSKPDMTIVRLEEGFHENRRAITKHYVKHLLKLYEGASSPTEECVNKIATIGARLMRTAKTHESPEKSNKGDAQYTQDVVRKLGYDNNETTKDLVSKIIDTMNGASAYEAKDEFIRDLEDLRSLDEKNPALNYLSSLNGGKPSEYLGALDALIIQAENFGLNALSSQIRQNRSEHERVYTKLLTLLPDEAKQQFSNSSSRANLLAYLNDSEHPERMQQLKRNVSAALDSMKNETWINDLSTAKESGREDDFYFYQTMKTLEFASKHTDFIPHYLIAECGYDEHAPNETAKANPKRGVDDMLTVLLFLNIMQPENAKKPLEIVPLVEHPEQVLEQDGRIPYVEMMKQAFENPTFRDHHQRVSDAQYKHLLTHTTVASDTPVALTGNDILASTNPEHGTRDYPVQADPKPVTMAKLCMGAGSDVTKFGGIGAAALMQNAMHRLKEELASMDKPVLLLDYIGCGGGVHRTQPVSNSFETVQGRSMRQTADAIATKITALLARNMRDRLASDPQDSFSHAMAALQKASPLDYARRDIPGNERKMLARLNLGNLANLPRNPAAYQNTSKHIIEKATRNYLEYTDTSRHPEYGALLSYSADMFCKLTSFAARPANRLGNKTTEQTFPPNVEMGSLRAIGYGGALNASGSSASLYLGLAEALKDVKDDDLVTAYTFDPKLQDTINRATYGVAMADLDTAWKYVGMDRTPNADTLKQLEAGTPDLANKKDLAKKALAHITLEHQALGRRLIALQSKMSQPPRDMSDTNLGSMDSNTISTTLINFLPRALSYQVQSSRENIKPAREALANIFKQQLTKFESGETPQPISREDDVYRNTIYPAMGAIFECYEHTPRAYTSPHWAMLESLDRRNQSPNQTAA